jgi:hypothetical protein
MKAPRLFLAALIVFGGALPSVAEITSIFTLPAGSANQVQFNDAGYFGGDSGLSYNKTTDLLTVTNISSSSGTISRLLVSTITATNMTISTVTVSSFTATAITATGITGTTLTITTVTASGALVIPDGTVTIPSVQFANETGTGLYRAASTNPAIAISGAQILSLTPTLVQSNTDFQVSRSVAGNSSFTVYNSSIGSSGNARLAAEVAATTGGDPFTLYAIDGGGANWATGSDNSDSDKYKISASGTLGTSDVLTLTTAGAATLNGSLTATGNITTSTGSVTASTITASSSFTATSANLTYANISSMTIAGPISMSGVTNSSGTFLISQGSTLTPKWQSAGLVFISTFTNITSTSTSGATFGNTNITKTVTAHAANSIFKITASFEAFHTAATLTSCVFTIDRGGNNICNGTSGCTVMTSSNSNQVPVSFTALDVPGTAVGATVTYTVQFRTGAAACTIDVPTRALAIEEYPQ